jgi:serine/threonine-protein kinase
VGLGPKEHDREDSALGVTVEVPRQPADPPQDEPEFLAGTPYRDLQLLAEGGAGQVYKAVHDELDKPVAIKVLHKDMSTDLAYAARFRREARAAAKIKHPGVVEVTDFGATADGRLFLVMELIEGETLLEVIRRGPLEPWRALEIAASICEVLHAVHEAGVVHRDVKPANVFLLERERVKLVDFGIARGDMLGGVQFITRTGRVIGTPGYMAPEQAKGQQVDGRTDLYSVGVVLYEMLTSVPPFAGDNPVEVLMAQITGSFTPPSRVVPGRGISREIDKAVRKLLAVRVSDRCGDAAEAASLLKALAARYRPTVSAEVVKVRPPTRLGRRVIVGVSAAVAVIAAATIAVLTLGPRHAGETPPPVEAVRAAEPVPADAVPTTEVHAAGLATDDPGAAGPVPVASRSDTPPVRVPGSRDVHSGSRATNPRANAIAGRPAGNTADPGDATSPPPAEAPEDRGAGVAPSEPGPEAPPTGPPAAPAAGPSMSLPDAADLLRRAQVAAVAGRAREAEDLYRQAGEAGADRAAVASGLGRLALVQGRSAEAIRWLEQAVALRPTSVPLIIDLGRAYQSGGRSDAAVRQWRAAIARDPGNAQALRLLRSVGVEP